MTSPTIQQCPSCSRFLHYSHEETNIIVCSCGIVVERKEGGVLLNKPYYILQKPYDIIQPGSNGKWEGREFKVLGRFRVWLEESVFNYWTLLFSDGEIAWLGEGYGFYAVMKKVSVEPSSYNKMDGLDVKDEENLLKDIRFVLERKSKVQKWELEGEVYLPERNSDFSIYEFSSVAGRQISVFRLLPKFSIAMEVFYNSFDSLEFSNTRGAELPGKTFTCSGCKQQVTVKTYPYAQSCVCAHCNNWYALTNGNFKALNKKNDTDTGPDIILGSIGTIKGIVYNCIGFTLKEENNQYRSQWKEYTLYNREEGYAFLSEFEGHWIYIREQGQAPVLFKADVRSLVYKKEPFQLYNSYSFIILNARGEFPDNIFDSAGTRCKEFISPPEVWIQEYNKKEGIVWYLGEHISGKELEGQFDFPAGLPYRSGIGAVEPKFYVDPYKLILASFVGILLLSMIHVIAGFSKQERIILDKIYNFNDSTNVISYVMPKVHLEKRKSNIEFRVKAPVQNDWFELNASVVNATTGKEYNIEKGVEYYSGYSGGESWTEGSKRGSAFITSIPSGDYIIQVQGMRNPLSVNRMPYFELMIIYDVPSHRNLWWSMTFLILWPVVQYFRTNSIEKKRWSNSPFSPHSYED